MRGSVLGLPLWLILAVCVVPPIAYSLSRAAAVPVELILPTAVAMEVVFLTQTVQQALRRAEVRRHFGFALWELHQELSQHLESLDRRMTLVRQGVTSEPNLDSLRTWASSVDAFPVDAWDRFLAVGGLHRLLDSAPDQVASNLYRYYHGVGTFNNEAALRERLLQKLFNVTGPATTGIFKSVKSSDKRLESWLTEVPSRLAVLMRDIQHVLGELGHMPGGISPRDHETGLAIARQGAACQRGSIVASPRADVAYWSVDRTTRRRNPSSAGDSSPVRQTGGSREQSRGNPRSERSRGAADRAVERFLGPTVEKIKRVVLASRTVLRSDRPWPEILDALERLEGRHGFDAGLVATLRWLAQSPSESSPRSATARPPSRSESGSSK